MDETEVAAYVEEHLDGPYVARTARCIARALYRSQPYEACFQPGDGTRYDLVFVPVLALEQAPPRRVRPQCPECRGTGLNGRLYDEGDPCPQCGGAGRVGELTDWESYCALGVSRAPGKTLVAWHGHNAYGLDLAFGGFVSAYIAEIFKCTRGSGAALAHLFNLIAEEFGRISQGAPHAA